MNVMRSILKEWRDLCVQIAQVQRDAHHSAVNSRLRQAIEQLQVRVSRFNDEAHAVKLLRVSLFGWRVQQKVHQFDGF